jgi:hypothetical protein
MPDRPCKRTRVFRPAPWAELSAQCVALSTVRSGDCVAASTDGGISFHLLALPPGFIEGFDASPDGRAILLTMYDASFTAASTFRSVDGGASFVAVSGLPLGIGRMAFDSTVASRTYTTDGQLHVSRDGDLTFSPIPNDPSFLGAFPVREIGVDSRGSVYLSNLAGPFRTDDRGKTFRSLLNEFRGSAVQDLAFDANGKLLVGVLHTQIVFRQTHGCAFSPLGTALIDPNGLEIDAAAVGGSPIDPNVILVATPDRGLLRTGNGGRSWTSAMVAGNASIFMDSRMAFVIGSRVYPAAPSRAVSGPYRSDDARVSFTRLSTLRFGALAVDPANSNVLYAGTFGDSTELFKSADSGRTTQSLGQAGDFSTLAVDRGSPSVVDAGVRFGQVIRSRDAGQAFTAASSGLIGAGVLGLTQDACGTVFVWVHGGGLFSSADGGSSWQGSTPARRCGVPP